MDELKISLRTYSKRQADELFEYGSIMILGENVFPVAIAVNLLGKYSVEYAKSKNSEGKRTWFKVCMHDRCKSWLTKAGFMQAVSCYNINVAMMPLM